MGGYIVAYLYEREGYHIDANMVRNWRFSTSIRWAWPAAAPWWFRVWWLLQRRRRRWLLEGIWHTSPTCPCELLLPWPLSRGPSRHNGLSSHEIHWEKLSQSFWSAGTRKCNKVIHKVLPSPHTLCPMPLSHFHPLFSDICNKVPHNWGEINIWTQPQLLQQSSDCQDHPSSCRNLCSDHQQKIKLKKIVQNFSPIYMP